MGAPRCGRTAADLSGFVDETLPPRRWERVGYHVAGCQSCRDEVEALQRVRARLRSRPVIVGDGASGLAARLEGIAGEGCDLPLYMASGPACALPTRREGRRRRMHQGGVAAIAAVASFFVLALLLAPDPPQVTNPVAMAREQFSLSSAAISVNEAVGAVLLAHGRGASAGIVEQRSARAGIVSSPRPLGHDEAAAALSSSDDQQLTYSGIQRVWVTDGDGAFRATDVQMDHMAGGGSSLVVLDARGNRYMSWFVPSSSCCDSAAPADWAFLEYQGLDQVAGRWAKVIEARDKADRPVSRWWVDTANGLLLWSERYDTSGRPTLISGFTELRLGQASLDVDRTELVILDADGDNAQRAWCVGLDDCPGELAGLPLVARASSDAGGRDTMRLVYSDGFRTVSVCWTEGVLGAEGATRIDAAEPGQPSVSVWQAGDGVVSVATNGGADLLHRAAGGLPPEVPWEPTLFDRLGRGLARLTGIQ